MYHKRGFVQQAVGTTVDDVTFVVNQDEVAGLDKGEVFPKGVDLMCEG